MTKKRVLNELYQIFLIFKCQTPATLNRSNGGATWISDGQIVRKWSYTLRPSLEKLEAALAEDPAALALETGSRGSLALQGFLLYVFAVLLLL